MMELILRHKALIELIFPILALVLAVLLVWALAIIDGLQKALRLEKIRDRPLPEVDPVEFSKEFIPSPSMAPKPKRRRIKP